MDYEIDLQTKQHAKQDAMWKSICTTLLVQFNSIPADERSVRHDDQIDKWCQQIASDLGLTYYRRDNWLCFCDAELAPN